MKRCTLWIALLAAALSCTGKSNDTSKTTGKNQAASSETPNKPPSEPQAPKPAEPEPAAPSGPLSARALAPLEVDPGEHPPQGRHLWSAKAGGVGNDSVRNVAIDAQGNVAIAGFFSSGADLGDGKLVDAQKVDVFVNKYSPAGELLWSVHFGGPGEDVGNSVAFDASGNVVVAGLFTGEVMVGEIKLIGQGSDDVFVAKLSPDGKPLWARRFGGLDSDAAYDVTTTPDGAVVVTGSFKGSAQAADLTLTSKGNEDIFVLALDEDGGLLWIKQFGERWRDFGQRVVVDRSGHIVLLAEFTGTVSFGGEPLAPKGNQDLALVKLSSRGEHVWSKRFGSPFNELGLGLAVDRAGQITMTGSFDNEITFGGDKLRSQGESDIFVAKFDTDGAHLWSKGFGAAREDIGYGVGTDKYGNVTIGGWFWHSIDFGGGPLTAPEGNKDAFLLKLSATGEHLWSKRFGDHDHDQVRGVAMNEEGRVAVAGIFRFTLKMGEQALEAAREPQDKAPHADIFVASFDP